VQSIQRGQQQVNVGDGGLPAAALATMRLPDYAAEAAAAGQRFEEMVNPNNIVMHRYRGEGEIDD
jgi:hypothetical protein